MIFLKKKLSSSEIRIPFKIHKGTPFYPTKPAMLKPNGTKTSEWSSWITLSEVLTTICIRNKYKWDDTY